MCRADRLFVVLTFRSAPVLGPTRASRSDEGTDGSDDRGARRARAIAERQSRAAHGARHPKAEQNERVSRKRIIRLMQEDGLQARAKMELFDSTEVFYNQRRRHSTLGQISPAAFERRAMTQAA